MAVPAVAIRRYFAGNAGIADLLFVRIVCMKMPGGCPAMG